jgi:hypothetical protein
MKTKSFQEYLGQRLSKKEISKIEERVEHEVEFLALLQKSIT